MRCHHVVPIKEQCPWFLRFRMERIPHINPWKMYGIRFTYMKNGIHSHTIHVWYIFIYMNVWLVDFLMVKYMVNVRKYIPFSMDCLGMVETREANPDFWYLGFTRGSPAKTVKRMRHRRYPEKIGGWKRMFTLMPLKKTKVPNFRVDEFVIQYLKRC